MRLFVLRRNDKPRYDEYDTFVIRAKSHKHARQMASESHADEGPDIWLDELLTTCETLPTKGALAIIVGSFNAG